MNNHARYYFVVECEDQTYDDEVGCVLADEAAARAVAEQIFKDLKADGFDPIKVTVNHGVRTVFIAP